MHKCACVWERECGIYVYAVIVAVACARYGSLSCVWHMTTSHLCRNYFVRVIQGGEDP